MKKIYLLSLIFIIIDIISKIIISNYLLINESIKVINNFFYLTFVHNYGAAWSIFEGKTYFLLIISICIIIGLIIYTKNKKITNKYEIFGYALLIGGAIGNLIDRIIYGYVIDFLDFNIFNYDFPIFNLADSFIVIGIIILIILSFIKEKK